MGGQNNMESQNYMGDPGLLGGQNLGNLGGVGPQPLELPGVIAFNLLNFRQNPMGGDQGQGNDGDSIFDPETLETAITLTGMTNQSTQTQQAQGGMDELGKFQMGVGSNTGNQTTGHCN